MLRLSAAKRRIAGKTLRYSLSKLGEILNLCDGESMAIPQEIMDEFSEHATALAAESGRSPDEIMQFVLRHGVESFKREMMLIQKAIGQADRGDFASDAEVDRVRNKYRLED